MRKLRYIHTPIKWFFVFLFTFLVSGNSFFTHTHLTNKGIIAHSHPFAGGKHSHTESEFHLISKLTHFSTTTNIFAEYQLKNLDTFLQALNTSCAGKEKHIIPYSLPALRAPPATEYPTLRIIG